MSLFEQLGINIDIDYIIVGMAAVIIFLFILIIVLFAKTAKQKKRLNKFMGGADAKSMESLIHDKLEDIQQTQDGIVRVEKKAAAVEEALQSTFSKSAIVKYDAFKEMGGKLSFVLVMLNANNNGFIINSMHSSREGCFTYIKEVIGGKSFVTLADEEKQALDEAVNSTNYME